MTRKMYDSIDPNSIPTNAQIVAGYIDGTSYKWPESAWSRFPNSVKVRIARRTTTNDGHVLDVESGIPTVWPPSQAVVDWVIMRRKAGVEPTIYCNQLNDWAGIRQLFQNAGVREPCYWVARYNNVAEIPQGAVAKQYANAPLAGGNYDLSVVADYWPGVDGDADMPLTDSDIKRIWEGAYSGLFYVIMDAANQAPPGGFSDGIRSALRIILNTDTTQSQLAALVAAHADGDHDLESILTRLETGQRQAIFDAIQQVATPALLSVFKDFIANGDVDEEIAKAVINAFAEKLKPTESPTS